MTAQTALKFDVEAQTRAVKYMYHSAERHVVVFVLEATTKFTSISYWHTKRPGLLGQPYDSEDWNNA
jgi:hypothetical protein